MAEPFQAFGARSKSRKRAADDLAVQLNELARSANRAQEIETVRSVTGLLVQSLEQERAGLRSAMQDILAVAEVLPLDRQTLQRADALERESGLRIQDAIVLASVLRHREGIAAGTSVFLNRNRKDFEDPDVVSLLEQAECRLISSFGDGLDFIRARLGAG